VLSRDTTSFFPCDLCTQAQSLARLGTLGRVPLAKVLDEAFRRQLVNFSPRDKVALLWALAKSEAHHNALSRLLVRSLAASDCSTLDRESSCAALWAVAQVWPSLPPHDPAPQLLAETLRATRPWQGASPRDLVDLSAALARLPRMLGGDARTLPLAEPGDSPPEHFSTRELCRVLGGLADPPPAETASAAEVPAGSRHAGAGHWGADNAGGVGGTAVWREGLQGHWGAGEAEAAGAPACTGGSTNPLAW